MIWVPGIEPVSPGSASSALDLWTICPAPLFLFGICLLNMHRHSCVAQLHLWGGGARAFLIYQVPSERFKRFSMGLSPLQRGQLGVWTSFEVGFYLCHRILHSLSPLVTNLHKFDADQWGEKRFSVVIWRMSPTLRCYNSARAAEIPGSISNKPHSFTPGLVYMVFKKIIRKFQNSGTKRFSSVFFFLKKVLFYED